MGGINKRDHLLKTGQEVIWSKGYDRSSIKDITQAAGLPKGSFYHYFDSKEKFALEAMQEYVDANKEIIPLAEPNLKTLEDLLDRRIQAVIGIHFSRECYMSTMCHAFSDQDESFRQAIVLAIEKSNTDVYELLVQLHKLQLIDPGLDIDHLAEYIDFSWRGARLKARILKSAMPLLLFKRFLFEKILPK